MTPPPELNITPIVTREHGEKFADEWLDRSYDTGAITGAFSETGIVEWPDDIDGQGRYNDIENDIAQRVADQLRSAAVDTFVRVANEVLIRWRESQRDPQ